MPLVLGAAPMNPVHVFEVTSDVVPGDGTHTIRAVAHAADGVSGQDTEALVIDVQPGGTDVRPPYVKPGPINGFTSAAIRDNGIDVAGYLETNEGTRGGGGAHRWHEGTAGGRADPPRPGRGDGRRARTGDRRHR